ncbi:MAG: effector-associated domain EAD1-containing protein [Chloroflexota bacterium]|nr:effector-associated domain EAD1-containing protein [Chloroflexota bacterium]
MELDNIHRKQLSDALCDAFRDWSKLERMLDHYLNVRLSKICREGDLEDVAFNVIEWFDSRGKLDDLIAGACTANPDNPLLRAFGDGLVPPPELRARYAAHLRAQFDRADLRGLVATEHARLHAANIRLHDIYVPLRAGVVDHRPTPRQERGDQEFNPLAESYGEPVPPFGFMRHIPPPPTRRERVAIDDLIATAPVAVILGDPGSGKSTALKHYALALLDDAEGPLPLIVSLAAYAEKLAHDPNLDVATFAAAFYAGRQVAGLEPLFAWAQRTGQLVYLLDGLDEVASERRGQVSAMVAALAQGRGANRVLATSRITGYIPLPLDEYAEATLDPLDADAQAAFAGGWYTVFGTLRGDDLGQRDRTAAALLAVIRDNPGVAKLADNPLTLTMLALLFFAGNADLPRQRVRLYGLVARTLIADWRKARNVAGLPVGSSNDELTVLKGVGPLAYWMHAERPAGVATRDEVARVLAKAEQANHPDEDPMPQVYRFLGTLSAEVGLLTEKGAGQWAFSHQTFQEYFAAREITRHRAKLAAEIARRARDPRWSEVIRLAIAYIGSEIGDSDDATDLVETAILHTTDPYELYLHRHLLLAGRVVADDPGVDLPIALTVERRVFDLWLDTKVAALAESAGEVIRDLLKVRALHDPLLEWIGAALAAERYRIVRFNVLAEDEAVQATLLARLSDPDSSVWMVAVRALAGRLASPAVQAALLACLSTLPWSVRWAATQALAGIAGEPAVQAALLAALSDPEERVRRSAAEALRNAAPDPALLLHLGALLGESWSGTANSAFATLAHWAERELAAEAGGHA